MHLRHAESSSAAARSCLLAAVLAVLVANAPSAAQAQQSSAKVPSTAPQRPLDAIAAALEPSRKIVYKTVAGRELHLHIFEPETRATERVPVALVIHGGGWTGGNPRRFYPFAAHFARQGLLGISLEYRLLNRKAGTTVFDCVKDGRSAIRYLRRHADELGIDPDRIVVAGGSAGAHVAAGTALFAGVDDENDDTSVSCRPDVLVLYYPVIDTSAEGYGQQKIGERWRELSPVDHVRPELPPCIVFHGTGDRITPFAGARRFHQQMRAAGNTCELVTHEAGRHGYFIFDLELYKQTMKQTDEFLREHLTDR